jgi:excisionase family DNA binding protein
MKAQTLINNERRGIPTRPRDRELLDDDVEKAKWDRFVAREAKKAEQPATLNNPPLKTPPEAQSFDLSDDNLIDELVTKVIEKLHERDNLPPTTGVPTLDDMPEFMNPDEVQDVLRISRATFFRLASKGEIPGVVKIGKALRIDRDQLKAYMKKTVPNV